ncbi:MAG: Uma2 family endonuclease [Myxococcales bacterium]|nr:Uma2 family endonuclease [Myxococcales bacterium]
MTRAWSDPVGPYRADQIREGEPYELSRGHRIDCMTAGGRHGTAHLVGSSVLNSDPGLAHAPAIDVGIEWNEGKNLRAPDIIAGIDVNAPGWARQAPPLAIEFADAGQDEAELRLKIAELLEFGTRLIWVVRLTGPLRVEIHEPGQPIRVVHGDGDLHAPGILQNPVPVRALIDRDAALDATLRNLLNREGYPSLAAVREEGREEGREAGREEGREAALEAALAQARAALTAQLDARGFTLSPALTTRVHTCRDLAILMRWLTRAVVSPSPEAALD